MSTRDTLSSWRNRRAAVRRHRAVERAVAQAPAGVRSELHAIADRG